MILPGFRARWFIFQVADPFPGLSFIIGNCHSQRVPAALSIVINQYPMAVPKTGYLRAGTGIGKVTIRHLTPRFPSVLRLTLMQALRRGTIIAHQCKKRSVFPAHDARLDIAPSDKWSAGSPRLPPIVRNRHKRYRKPVGIEGYYQSFVVEDEWVSACHPSHTPVEFISCTLAHPLNIGLESFPRIFGR